MSDSDLGNAGIIQQAIRGVGAILDKIFFGLLVVVFQIFFNVASAELFTGESILKFVGRVQLILGVFTMFQLAMSILKGIVNPDQFFSKDKGFSNVITKVVIALFLLALIMPISIPGAKNEYEKQVNNNGILFGTLYSLQHRLLSNNTLGRLILGSDNSSSTFMGDDESELKSASNIFASTILKTFIKINLVEEKDRTHVDGKTDDQISSNWVCSDMNDYVDVYKQDDVDPDTLLNLVGDTCGSDDRGDIAEAVSMLTASDYFKFTYSPFISTIVAGIFAFILLGFCVDVAIRAVKLSVLRIIAPVPILSYMNPSGGKDGSLNSWIKTLTSTYLDLFIRLAVVYFAIFLIMDIISEGIVINIGFTENPLIGGVSTVLIFLGIFFFAKEAPKFFKDMLGLKGDSSMFGGIGKALGFGAVAGGVFGAFNSARVASREADIHNNGEAVANRFLNRGKHLASGITGGISGAVAGLGAYANAKNNQYGAVKDAYAKHNERIRALGHDGGTFLGGVGAHASTLFTGESEADRLERNIKRDENAIKNDESLLKVQQDINNRRKSIMDRVSSKAVDSDKTSGTFNGVTGNYRAFHSAWEGAKARGVSSFVFNGQNVSIDDAEDISIGLLDENKNDYYTQVLNGTINDASIITDADAFRAATGGRAIENTFGDLKAAYGTANADNKTASDSINARRQQLNEQRNSAANERAQANAKRFGKSGK